MHDQEMTDLPPPMIRQYRQQPIASISPAIMPRNSQASPHLGSAGATPTNPFPYPPSADGHAGSAFEPMTHASGPPGSQFGGQFALSSPALRPVIDDQEATAALLMLNTDRRSWSEMGGSSGSSGSAGNSAGATSGSRSGSVRGMSVRDLLSA